MEFKNEVDKRGILDTGTGPQLYFYSKRTTLGTRFSEKHNYKKGRAELTKQSKNLREKQAKPEVRHFVGQFLLNNGFTKQAVVNYHDYASNKFDQRKNMKYPVCRRPSIPTKSTCSIPALEKTDIENASLFLDNKETKSNPITNKVSQKVSTTTNQSNSSNNELNPKQTEEQEIPQSCPWPKLILVGDDTTNLIVDEDNKHPTSVFEESETSNDQTESI